uniref:Uncharacterized protein n=1 Tax=viral metagenome TaxID=1070528 RepID=A0A6C0EW93_9ZZZZ
MANLIKYYTNRLDDLNKKYDEYTINYKENFVKYKILVFNCDLSRGALNTPTCINKYSGDTNVNAYVIAKENLDNLNSDYVSLTKEIKALFTEQAKFVDAGQKKIDDLNDENKELLEKSTNIKDVSATSQPFFHNERLLYYRSVIYFISIIIGIIFVLYMLQSTPFMEVASSVATNTKNLAATAVNGAKGMVENAATNGGENPDGTGSDNMLRNIIILVLISLVIISVFYFIIYILRKVNPPLEKTNAEKEIKKIADTCLKDKSDSWFNAQVESLKKFLTNK